MPEISADIFAARLISAAIGVSAWDDLLMSMPDHFFDLGADERNRIWRTVLRAANGGERDARRLKEIAIDAMLAQTGAA